MEARILHLVKTSVGGTWAYRLMRELVKKGFEIHVAMPLGGPLVEQYKAAGIIVHELNFSLKHLFSNISALRKLVKDLSPDIIHSHFVLTTLLMRLALRKSKIPRIFEVPGPLHLESAFFRKIEIALSQTCDYWVPTCRWSYECYLHHGVDKSHLFLTYYGGDISHATYQKGKLRKELGLISDQKIIGMVAFMYAPKKYLGQKRGIKGHEDFIDAMKIVCEKYPDVVGVCVGGAWNGAAKYESHIRQYAKRHCPSIRFLGTRNDVGELYQDFYMAVHPSHSENLGGAEESLLLNVPTISTRVGGFPDIVIDGKTGVTVPPKEPEKLAEAIMYMLENPSFAKQSAAEGQKLVSQLCDINHTTKEMVDIYHAILSQGHSL